MIRTVRLPIRCVPAALALSLILGGVGCGRQSPTSAAVDPPIAAVTQPVIVAASTQRSAPRNQDSTAVVQLPTATPAPQIAAESRIPLGPGFTNNFNHALVRTAEDRLYVLINNDTSAKIGAGPAIW